MGRQKKNKVHFGSVERLNHCILKVLVRLRKDNNLTQQELAVKLGRHKDTVNKIENKLYVPSLKVLRDYGLVFNLTLSEILKEAEDIANNV